MDRSANIISSWNSNAKNWIDTIENSELESRVLATNDAIINAVLNYRLSRVLDLGCGEGWLARTLRNEGLSVYGTDAVKTLIEYAQARDGNYYFQYSYQEIYNGEHKLPCPFDAVVINFALIDKQDTESLLAYLPSILVNEGLLFVQTLHPLAIAATGEYISGWKEGSWNGMKRDFEKPYQWYFRTMSDWISSFHASGFTCIEMKEPLHPETGKPLSVIFILRTHKR
jgi:2-polyprenyl-3-methyl-5-hydroxy-6-metoxy-1,4-benzoquinol methylase